MTDGPARPELAATLRRLRLDAGLSGIEAPMRAGLSQSMTGTPATEVVDHDFWLVDHERPVRMHYDDGDRVARWARPGQRHGEDRASMPAKSPEAEG